MFFDKALFYFIRKNKLIIIMFVLYVQIKNTISIIQKQRQFNELQLLFKIVMYSKVMNPKEIIYFNNRKE